LTKFVGPCASQNEKEREREREREGERERERERERCRVSAVVDKPRGYLAGKRRLNAHTGIVALMRLERKKKMNREARSVPRATLAYGRGPVGLCARGRINQSGPAAICRARRL